MQKCSECGVVKELTFDNFGKAKQNKNGYKGQCKTCVQAKSKIYREKNKERLNKQNREYNKNNKDKRKEYYEQNKEKIREYNKEYYHNNLDYFRESSKQYWEANRERLIIENREYYYENRDEIAVTAKKYQMKHKERIKQHRKSLKEYNRQRAQKRRAKIKKLPHSFTGEEWDKTLSDFDHSCAYCGMSQEEHRQKHNQPLHQEHFIPLYSGGEYTANNIIPSCQYCNFKKNNRDFFEWYPSYEHYDKEKEVFILKYLGYGKNKTQQLSIL